MTMKIPIYYLLSSPKRRTKGVCICKLTEVMHDKVKRIYSDEEVSYTLPDIRFFNYRFMSMTLKEAYQVYLRKCQTDRKVADSTFSAMKPKMICTVQETALRGCKCEYCQNLGLLRETLIGLGFKGIPKNHAALIEITWCNFQKKLIVKAMKRSRLCTMMEKCPGRNVFNENAKYVVEQSFRVKSCMTTWSLSGS